MATTGQDGGGTVYIRPVVSADGVAAGVADIKQEFASIPAAAQQAAQSTNRSLASLGVPAESTASVARFKEAFGDIGRVTSKELGESARATNAFVNTIKREASNLNAVTQELVNKKILSQQDRPELQNKYVTQAIEGLQKLATQNAITAEATLKQASAQQVANKAASEAAIQFGNFERSAAAARLELLSFGKTASEKYQIRAELLGIDKTQAVQKIVADLKAAEAAALAAGKGVGAGLQQPLERLGMTAKQTTAALRQVPAQFTDIIVSLQGGQAPLTVLLQQGGQLKDVFGGVGAAAKALGGYVLGLVNPFTVVAGSAALLAVAYTKGAAEAEGYNKALILTGNAAGTTATQMSIMAQAIAKSTGSTVGAAAEALAAFAASGSTSIANMQRFAATAEQLNRVAGVGVADTVKQFEELGKSPVDASTKLNASINYLTLDIYKQIKALEDQGRVAEAGALAQRAYADAIDERIPKLVANLGLAEKAWKNVGSVAKKAWDDFLGVGRTEDPVAQVAERLKDAQNRLAQLVGDAKGTTGYELRGRNVDIAKQQAIVDGLKEEVGYTSEIERIAKRSAGVAADRARIVAANVEWDKKALGYATQTQKMEKEIAAARILGREAQKSEEEIAKSVARIRENYKEKSPTRSTKETITDAQRSLSSYLSDVQKRIDKEEELTEVQKAQNLLASLGTLGQIAQVRELVLGRATLVDTQLAETAAAKESAKALEEKSKVLDKWYDLRVKDSADLDSQISKRQKEVDAIGETAEAIGELTAAKYDEAAANKESYAAALQNASAYAGEFKDAYLNAAQDARDQAAKLRELSRLSTLEGTKKASVEAAKEATKAWQKGWEETDRLAREVFVTWAEDGSNAAKKIGDTLKKALLSAIYEATIKPVAFQIYSSATSALGLPGSSGSGGGLLKNASDAYGLYDKASSFFGGGASSAFGFAGMAGAGTAAGATAVLPAVTTAAIEAGITAGGASIYSLGAAAGAAGVSLPTFGAGLGGSFGGAAGATTLGTTVAAPLAGGASAAAAIPGIGWAIGGALLLAGLFGGGGGRYVQSTGETSLNFDGSGKETYRAPYRFQGMDEATAKEYGMKYVDLNEGANNFATSLNKTYLSAAKSLGITAAASNFAYGGNDADSSTGQGKFRLGAGVVGGKSYFNSGEIAKSDEALKLAASRAVLTALSGSEMPKYLAGVFDSVGDIATNSQAQIDAVLATAQSFKALHDSLDQLPFDNLKDQTYAVYKALTDAAGGLEQFGQKLSGYYDNFYSAEEKRTQTLKGISKRLADGGINVGVDALEKMSRADFRALFETIQTTFTGQASTGMVAALLDVQGAFASVTAASADAATALASTRKALLDAATGAASAALSGLTKSVEAQKTALTSAYDLQVGNFTDQLTNVTTSVSKLQSLASSLKGTLDGLRIAGSDGQYRSAAQAQISTALATARSGGGLPLDGQLANALQTVSRPSEQLFATFTDYARDFYKTANDIASLSDLTGEQLSADEAMQGLLQDQIDLAKRSYDAQVSGLDEIATLAQSQLDAANGTYAAILSLSDAIKASTAATQDLLNARGQQGLTTGAVVGGGLQSVKPDVARLDSINTYVNTLDFSEAGAANSVQQLYAAAQQYGVNQSELAAATGYRLEDVQKLFTKYGIPAFAVGTNYIPNDMVAMLHEGEAVVPKAYNPAAGGDSNSALLDEMRAMRAEIAALRASAADTADNTKRTASTLVNVTRGGEAMQTQVFA